MRKYKKLSEKDDRKSKNIINILGKIDATSNPPLFPNNNKNLSLDEIKEILIKILKLVDYFEEMNNQYIKLLYLDDSVEPFYNISPEIEELKNMILLCINNQLESIDAAYDLVYSKSDDFIRIFEKINRSLLFSFENNNLKKYPKFATQLSNSLNRIINVTNKFRKRVDIARYTDFSKRNRYKKRLR